MDDLISRAKVMDAVEDAADTVFVSFGDEEYVSVDELKRQLLALPSAQPDIIRCKDCKHWREGTSFSYCDKLHGMGVLNALDYMTAEDDYCSMAERRTDDSISD